MKSKFKQHIYSVKSPAKLNIGLRIISKRKDGFHNLETIFYPVKIYDKITVKIKKLSVLNGNNNISVKTDSNENISGKNNICYKNLRAVYGEFRVPGFV